MKRTKQVQEMVNITNTMLERNRVVDQYNPDAHHLMWLLLELHLYKGFNWFYYNEAGIKCYAGTDDPDKLAEMNGFLQIL